VKILITGGAGFIGQHVARHLVDGGHAVTALDVMHPQVHLDPDAAVAAFPGAVRVGDVVDEDAWRSVGPIDAVVHLAAETGTGQSMYEPGRYARVNVGGTALAASYAERWGAPLVAMSSRAVYGEGRHRCPEHGAGLGRACCALATPVASREDDDPHPVSVYGETKALGEREVQGVAPVVPVTVIRPQNVIGPGQALHNPYTGVLSAFLAMLREGRPVTVYGDGSQTRDFVHVDDLATLVAWAVRTPGPVGSPRVLNCGSGVRTTLLELAHQAHAGRPDGVTEPPRVEHLEVRRAGDVDHACADLSRLRDVGAPLPSWTTPDAVADFVRFSWDRPGAAAATWSSALAELADRGLTS
jgi:dTDP-L-rhamnose 4-epimerase